MDLTVSTIQRGVKGNDHWLGAPCYSIFDQHLTGLSVWPNPVRISLAPDTVDEALRRTGVVILKDFRKTIGPDIVKRLQHRESNKRAGDSNRCESGMSGGGERAAVIHRG